MHNWFIFKNGKKLGPYSSSQIKSFASQGKLDPTDYLAKEGSVFQKQAKDIKGLFTAYDDEEGQDTTSTTESNKSSEPDLSLPSYLWKYWEATQVSFLYPFLISLVLIPSLSILKPRLGYQGLFDIAEIVSVLAIGMSGVYILRILGSFYLGRKRLESDILVGFLGQLGSFMIVLGFFFLIPLAIVEKFMPPAGLLVRILPYTKIIQKDLGLKFDESVLDQEIDLPSNNPNRKLTSLSAKKAGFRFYGIVASAVKSVNVRDYIIKDGELAFIVVSDGSGKSEDEALKESFRNAVSQVVGTLVDSELIIQNDRIIEEKLLTYSNGFIKTYEMVSSTVDKSTGLHRVKIRAEVRKQNVIAELKSSNITVNEIDGEGLFSEIITKMEAEKKAFDLFERQFMDIPDQLIKATNIGQPREINKSENNVRLELLIKVEPNVERFIDFSNKLIETISPMAKSNGQFSVSFDQDNQGEIAGNNPGSKTFVLNKNQVETKMPDWIREAFDGDRIFKPNGSTFLAIATNITPNADRIDYKYFELPATYRKVMNHVISKKGHLTINLLDKMENTVVTDSSPLDDYSDNDMSSSLVVSMKEFDGIYWISPSFFLAKKPDQIEQFRHKKSYYITHQFNLSAKEILSLRSVKTVVQYYD